MITAGVRSFISVPCFGIIMGTSSLREPPESIKLTRKVLYKNLIDIKFCFEENSLKLKNIHYLFFSEEWFISVYNRLVFHRTITKLVHKLPRYTMNLNFAYIGLYRVQLKTIYGGTKMGQTQSSAEVILLFKNTKKIKAR